MFNEYEDYMQSNYPMNNTYDVYNQYNPYFPYRARSNFNNSKYEVLYPEIYRKLKPFVEDACNKSRNSEVSNDLLEVMSSDIYSKVSQDGDVVNSNITTKEAEGSTGSAKKDFRVAENQNDVRGCCNNPMLKDLIKILLIQQLLKNNNPRPPFPKPPYTPNPPRPPYRAIDDSIYTDYIPYQ